MIRDLSSHSRHGRLRDPAVAPRRYRLKPVAGDWPSPDEVAASAGRLFVPSGGGAIRTVITGTKKHSTGMQPSFKTRRKQYHEGRAELALIMVSEVEPRIVDFQTQGARFETVVDGKRHIHIVDMMRELDTGEVEMIEVKRNEGDLRDPEYRLKLAVVGESYRGLRWIPRVILEDEIFLSKVHQRNVSAVYAQHFAEVSDEQLRAVRRLRATRRTILDLGEFERLLDPCCRHRARAVAFALMVRREVMLDLAMPLTAGTDVRVLPSPKPPSGKIRFS